MCVETGTRELRSEALLYVLSEYLWNLYPRQKLHVGTARVIPCKSLDP